ncbi:MAG: ATP-binding protein [Verrucomicrobia bacterium]|nr:ATP-binding protein [Verrucomicrobiota bacterium]
MPEKNTGPVQGTLFEEDFLVRSLGSIAHSADVALTELVANAWDAGASEVRITIPPDHDLDLVVEDDGCGMTPDQFKKRWMTLGYDRTKHQGRKADFPPERQDWRRMAFGRNGVGRHGLLCFADHYEVETCRDGEARQFVVATSSGDEPFVLRSESPSERKSHGTKLRAKLERNLASPDRIREVLAARFLHDPKFTVFVNERSVPLTELPGLVEQTTITINDRIDLHVTFIDSTEVARTIRHQGVAFWVGGRLVGEPSWTWGKRVFVDGRTHFAKRYTVVVKTDALFDEALPDWSDFRKSEVMDAVFEEVEKYVRGMFQKVSSERIQETKEAVFRENIERLQALSPRARYEVSEFVEELSKEQPTMQSETISVAVQAMINLEQSHSGSSLLEKLAKLSEEDIEGLDRLLSEWTVRDALTVLDEIDRRLATIEAIKKLSSESKTDELHTLHPLVTQARWLFGPDFDSAEYASNVSLQNAVKEVFGERL